MASQCHSSWRLFHLPPRPSQITYYITVHLISKDTLTTPLNKDEKSCSVILLAHKHVSFYSTCMRAPPRVFACAPRPTMCLPQQHLSLHRHYYTFLSSPHWKNLSSIRFVSTVNSSSVHSLCTEWQVIPFCRIMCCDKAWISTKFKKTKNNSKYMTECVQWRIWLSKVKFKSWRNGKFP